MRRRVAYMIPSTQKLLTGSPQLKSCLQDPLNSSLVICIAVFGLPMCSVFRSEPKSHKHDKKFVSSLHISVNHFFCLPTRRPLTAYLVLGCRLRRAGGRKSAIPLRAGRNSCGEHGGLHLRHRGAASCLRSDALRRWRCAGMFIFLQMSELYLKRLHNASTGYFFP